MLILFITVVLADHSKYLNHGQRNKHHLGHRNIISELEKKALWKGPASYPGHKSFLKNSAANAPRSFELSRREIGKSVQTSETFKRKSAKMERSQLHNTGRKFEKNYREGLKELADLI